MSLIPVFFCEQIGERWVLYGRCACGVEAEHVYPAGAAPGEYEKAWPGPACKCGKLPEISCRIGRAVFRRPDTGAVINPNGEKLPAGAVYATRDPYRTGPDGRYLVCVVPGNHHWSIDGRASNCTLPEDDAHRCWVRRGRPEDGTLHVSKEGLTCKAGAGSIAVPGYHGYLHNGALKPC